MLIRRHHLPAALIAILSLFAANIQAAEAGKIQFVSGTAQVIDANGKTRAATKGDAVQEGETLTTGAESAVQLLMADKGLIAIRPNSQLKIDSYRYAGKDDGSEKGTLALSKGSFRSITGMIGKTNKDAYKITTPTATIGIRGTDHEPSFIPQAGQGEQQQGEPGTYDRVNSGMTYILTPLGIIEIGPNQIGFAPFNSQPLLLGQMPAFFRVTPELDLASLLSADGLRTSSLDANAWMPFLWRTGAEVYWLPDFNTPAKITDLLGRCLSCGVQVPETIQTRTCTTTYMPTNTVLFAGQSTTSTTSTYCAPSYAPVL